MNVVNPQDMIGQLKMNEKLSHTLPVHRTTILVHYTNKTAPVHRTTILVHYTHKTAPVHRTTILVHYIYQ